ncbi:MAG: hypothetical protein LBH97_07900 [Treponema sp.]|nr:hypothetical protein [Treponema sp.]
MKKIIIVVLVLSMVTAATVFAQSEEVMMYDTLYRNTSTHMAQLVILQNIKEARLTGAGEFYARILHRLIADYRLVRNATERNAAEDQAIIISQLLGDEKYTEAAPDLWQLVDVFPAPLVKAEAMIALGRVEAKDYLPPVIQILRTTNAGPTRDVLNGERIAFGAIIALEKYQDPDGILPVFSAATGWYSSRIKNQALRSLSYIMDDPTTPMINVVKGSSFNYAEKFTALQFIENYQAPEEDGSTRRVNVSNESKASVAVAALAEGWRVNTSDRQAQGTIISMRKMAIAMINKYKTTDDSVYTSLDRSYTRGDQDERFAVVAALASLGTDEAAQLLSGYLMELNGKRQIGDIRRGDEDMVRAIISALGTTKNAIGRPALNSVLALDWTPAVKNLAREALQN